MAAPTFELLIERVLGHEGGYVNDPADPGGETRWGISKRAYPHEDIANLSRERAIALYRADYWDRIRGDELPPAIAFQALDAAVNHGTSRAILWLQQAAGADDDGVMGPRTMLALKTTAPMALLVRFNAARLEFYTDLNTFGRFGKGWTRRVAENLIHGLKDAAA